MLRITVFAAIVGLVSGAAPIKARQLPRPCDTYTQVVVDTVLDVSDPESRKLVRPIVNGGPAYPKEMRNSGIEGSVRMSFVLDTLGRIIRHTAQITEESDHAFGRSVCEFLGYAKFVPVSVGGRTLTTRLTNMPFKFMLGSPR